MFKFVFSLNLVLLTLASSLACNPGLSGQDVSRTSRPEVVLEPGGDDKARENVANLWGCPEDKLVMLDIESNLKSRFSPPDDFVPVFVKYWGDNLYVYDQATRNVLIFSKDLELIERVFEDGSLTEQSHFSMYIDEEGRVIIAGAENIYISGNPAKKMNNMYNLYYVMPANNLLYSLNADETFASRDSMLDIFDYELKYIKSVGEQLYPSDKKNVRTNVRFAILENKLYIFPVIHIKIGIMDLETYDLRTHAPTGKGLNDKFNHNEETWNRTKPPYKYDSNYRDASEFEGRLYVQTEYNNNAVIAELNSELGIERILYFNYVDKDDYSISPDSICAYKNDGDLHLAVTFLFGAKNRKWYERDIYIFTVK